MRLRLRARTCIVTAHGHWSLPRLLEAKVPTTGTAPFFGRKPALPRARTESRLFLIPSSSFIIIGPIPKPSHIGKFAYAVFQSFRIVPNFRFVHVLLEDADAHKFNAALQTRGIRALDQESDMAMMAPIYLPACMKEEDLCDENGVAHWALLQVMKARSKVTYVPIYTEYNKD